MTARQKAYQNAIDELICAQSHISDAGDCLAAEDRVGLNWVDGASQILARTMDRLKQLAELD
jgi:hypothetical protein